MNQIETETLDKNEEPFLNYPENENSKQNDENQEENALIKHEQDQASEQEPEKERSHTHSQINKNSLLGPHVIVSLAFSQQAMQTKKKIKESRKKPGNLNTHFPGGTSPRNMNIHSPPANLGVNNNLNAAAMLAMMNFMNNNKVVFHNNINLII